MKTLSVRMISFVALLVFLPNLLLAQAPDQNTGDRERYVNTASGKLVAVVSPVDDEAKVVYREGAEEFDVIGFGDSVPGLADLADGDPAVGIGEAKGPVYGVGHPAMNDQGVIAVTVALTSEHVEIDRLDQTNAENDNALLVGTPGNMQLIAHTLQNIDGDVICSLEPMPQINNDGQVFFSATLQSPNLHDNSSLPATYCSEDGGNRDGNSTNTSSMWSKSRKGIFRYTPGTGVERLLFASMKLDESETITTSDSRWVSAQTNYYITDAQLIAHSHNSVTSDGAAFAKVWLTDSETFSEDNSRSDNGDYRQGIVYLNGNAAQLVAATVRSPEDQSAPPPSTDFGYLGKIASNSGGRLVFKTALSDNDISCANETSGSYPSDSYCYDDGLPSQLYVFTPNSGLSAEPLVASGDPVPGAVTSTFNGFPPLMSTNDTGAVAFTAGLNIPEICEQTISANGLEIDGPPDDDGEDDWADFCKGVYLARPDGSIIELARNTRAAFDGDGVGATKWTSEDGSETFYFDGLTATAILDRQRSDRVYFVASQYDSGCDDSDPNYPGCLRPDPVDAVNLGRFSADKYQSYEESSEYNEPVGIFAWENGTIRKIIAEGDEVILGDDDTAWEPVVGMNNDRGIMDRLAAVFGIAPAYAQTDAPTATVVRLFLPQPQLRGHTGEGEFEFAVRAWFDVTGDGQADFDSMVNPGEILPPVPVPTNSNTMAIILGVMLMLLGLVILRGRA